MRYDMNMVRSFTGLSRHDISDLIAQGMAYPKMMELSKKFYEKEDLIKCKIIAILYKFGFNPANIGYIMTNINDIPIELTNRMSVWDNGNVTATTENSTIEIVSHCCKKAYGMLTINVYGIREDIADITYKVKHG